MKKILLHGVKSFAIIIIAYLASFFKISFMVGSETAYFSGVNAIAPLTGMFGGITGVLLLFFSRISFFSFEKMIQASFLAHVIPGVSASLYWAVENKIARFIIQCFLPAICILFFIIHPVGIQAYTYSFFWLLPIVIYFLNFKSLFLHTLASTFIAHAVGSIIWLYTVSMTVTQWHALIPIVFLERLFFASAMVVMSYVCTWLFETAEKVLLLLQRYSYKQHIK